MALVKFGGGIIQASGSIAGVTHARNRFGNYIRPRTKPVNPRSDRQSAARALVQMLTAYWNSGAMDDEKRLAWGTYGNAVVMKNRLGENTYITGFNHFLRSNISRQAAGGNLVEDAPVILSLPGADETIAFSADAGTQLLTIAFDDTLDWASEDGGFLSIAMGQPQLHTRNYFGGPFRNAGGIAGSTGAPITSPQTLVAPYTLVNTQKIWLHAKLIRADGRVSSEFFAPAVIVGGLLPIYNVTGALTPNAVCNYNLTGAFNSKAYYKRTDGAYHIWWDGTSKWYISVALGTPGTAYWTRTNVAIAGEYVIGGTAEGTATVAGGTHG